MTTYIDTPSVGEILREEFMEPLGLSAYKLAHGIHVPVSRVQDIIHDRRKITVDTSLRLGKYLGVSELYFYNIQCDIEVRRVRAEIGDELKTIVPFKGDKAG